MAPGILIMVASFPRFVIAFAILRSGMGLATTPSNMIMVSLALLTKVAARPEQHRYVFFIPAFRGNTRLPQLERSGIQVWSVEL